MAKLPIYNPPSEEKRWDEKAAHLAKTHPLKTLSHFPSIPGISKETAKHLRWKSFKYLIQYDHTKVIPRYFFKHPIRYGTSLLTSLFKKKSFKREGDFFFYGLSSFEEFETLLTKKTTLFVVGFSYCHKPLECPSGRFSSDCIHDPEHPVCGQCFIGKAVHFLPSDAVTLFIPTIHYIGEQLFILMEKYPDKKIAFLITACEMTLEMFGDLGNMTGIKGIGVRLDGRICNTMKAFVLSEKGIKPGLTVVLEPTQKKMLEIIQYRKAIVDFLPSLPNGS